MGNWLTSGYSLEDIFQLPVSSATPSSFTRNVIRGCSSPLASISPGRAGQSRTAVGKSVPIGPPERGRRRAGPSAFPTSSSAPRIDPQDLRANAKHECCISASLPVPATAPEFQLDKKSSRLQPLFTVNEEIWKVLFSQCQSQAHEP